MTAFLEDIVERVKQSPSLVVVDDYELAIEKVASQAVHFESGIRAASRESSHVWMSLRVIHRKQPGKAILFASSPADAAMLISLALESSKSTMPDPWFRFPIWRSGGSSVVPREVRSRSSLPSASATDCASGFDVDEIYEVAAIETRLVRKHERSAFSHEREEHSARLQVSFPSGGGFASLRDFRAQGVPLESGRKWLAQLVAQSLEQSRAVVWNGAPPGQALLRPSVVASLLRAVAPTFFADALEGGKGRSLSRSRIFPEVVTLVDDGCLRGGVHFTPFDLEGTSSQRTALIEKGCVTGALFDTYHATRENRLSTGNWRRPVDSPYPRIGVTQLILEPQAESVEGMVRELGTGVVIESLDPVAVESGRIVGLGRGWRVDSGCPVAPVSSIPVDWAAQDVLRSITCVGNDLNYFGCYGAPSILCRNLPKGS